MDLFKPVSYIFNHANTQFTHLWHICHKKLLHCSRWLSECSATRLLPEPAYVKHGSTKASHFQEIVASGNVLES